MIDAGQPEEAEMPVYTIDLHNHTPLIPTDYRGPADTSPRAIVEAALDAGIDVWGATDHSSVAWADLLIEAADEVFAQTGRRLLVVPGAELKVRHLGSEAHVVVLFEPGTQAEGFAALLERFGLAQPLVPRVEDLPRFVVEADPAAVYAAAEELGAMAHVGHIDRAFGSWRLADEHLMHHLLAAGVRRYEIIDHDSWTHLFAEGEPCTVIRSSDSHSIAEIGRRTTSIELPELSFAALREALSAGNGCVMNGEPVR